MFFKCNISVKAIGTETNGYCHRMTLIEQYANLSIARYRLTNMIYKGAKCIYLQFNYCKYFEVQKRKIKKIISPLVC